MRIIRYPSREEWSNIVKRPQLDVSQLNAIVDEVLTDIRRNGDSAVKAYEAKFDHVELQSLAVTDEEIFVNPKDVHPNKKLITVI